MMLSDLGRDPPDWASESDSANIALQMRVKGTPRPKVVLRTTPPNLKLRCR